VAPAHDKKVQIITPRWSKFS